MLICDFFLESSSKQTYKQNRHVKGDIEKLNFPVGAALVRERSELPEESAGDSCDFMDAAEFGIGEFALCSESIPEIFLG
jgi:hypothetical protein